MDILLQLGRVICLTDFSKKVIPFSHKSYKSRRAARSELWAGRVAFADLAYVILAVRKEQELILKLLVLVYVLADSKNLFVIICKRNLTNERKIFLYTYADNEAYKSRKICNNSFVKSTHNLVDGRTKTKHSSNIIQATIHSISQA